MDRRVSNDMPYTVLSIDKPSAPITQVQVEERFDQLSDLYGSKYSQGKGLDYQPGISYANSFAFQKRIKSVMNDDINPEIFDKLKSFAKISTIKSQSERPLHMLETIVNASDIPIYLKGWVLKRFEYALNVADTEAEYLKHKQNYKSKQEAEQRQKQEDEARKEAARKQKEQEDERQKESERKRMLLDKTKSDLKSQLDTVSVAINNYKNFMNKKQLIVAIVMVLILILSIVLATTLHENLYVLMILAPLLYGVLHIYKFIRYKQDSYTKTQVEQKLLHI